MREDTRTKIQDVALELFIEQGYEATSLREIAERLGVTKAALYYHFKTKDDIVLSLAERRLSENEALLAWLKEQPKTPETRAELIRRYGELLLRGDQKDFMRFMERNQTSMRHHPTVLRMREVMFALVEELAEPGDPLTTRIRRSMALFTMHAGVWLSQNDPEHTEEERREAAMEVALDLLER